MTEQQKRENFSKGWLKAVKWIYDSSIASNMTYAGTPSGESVRQVMMSLPKIPGIDAGFAEGLIYTMGRPISDLKKHLK